MKKASKRQQISKLDSIFHATKKPPESVTYFKIRVCIVISLFLGVSLNSVEVENFVLKNRNCSKANKIEKRADFYDCTFLTLNNYLGLELFGFADYFF